MVAMGVLSRIRAFLAKASPPYPSASYQFVPRFQAGVAVTHETALKYTAVWACVRYISETIAGLPWHVFRMRPDGGREREVNSDLEWLLHREPHSEMTAFTFREILVAWALMWGNGYAEITRDRSSRPVSLTPIAPDRVVPERDAGGELVYRVWNDRGTSWVYVRGEDMFHLRGLGFDGLTGYSVISTFAQTIGLGLAAETMAAGMFANSAVPGGIIEGATFRTDEARRNFHESWNKESQGPSKYGKIRLLPAGLTYKQIGIPPNDAQFLESRQFGVVEIARVFRVPLHKIGDLSGAKYANIEQQNIDATQDCQLPWIRRLETEADRKLVGRNNRGVVFTRINLDGLLRGDSVARGERYTKMIAAGVMSVNEARALEEMNPIGPDGDKHVMQSGFTTIERIGEDQFGASPPVAKDANGDAADGAEDDAENSPALGSSSRGLVDALAFEAIRDCSERAIRRERYIVRDALRGGGDPVQGVVDARSTLAKLFRRAIRTYGAVLAKELSESDISEIAEAALSGRESVVKDFARRSPSVVIRDMESMEGEWSDGLTRAMMNGVSQCGVGINGNCAASLTDE